MQQLKEPFKPHIFSVRLSEVEHRFLENEAMRQTVLWQREGNKNEVTMVDVLRHALREYMKAVQSDNQ